MTTNKVSQESMEYASSATVPVVYEGGMIQFLKSIFSKQTDLVIATPLEVDLDRLSENSSDGSKLIGMGAEVIAQALKQGAKLPVIK